MKVIIRPAEDFYPWHSVVEADERASAEEAIVEVDPADLERWRQAMEAAASVQQELATLYEQTERARKAAALRRQADELRRKAQSLEDEAKGADQ